MKKLFLGLISVVTVIAGGAWLLQSFSNDQIDIPSPPASKIKDIVGSQFNDELETNPDQVLTKKDAMKTGVKHAKSIVFVPDNNPDSSKSEREIDIEFQQSVKQMVELSLNGEKEEAITLSRLMNQCSVYSDDESKVHNMLESLARNFSPHTTHYVGSSESRSFESFEAYETHVWERYDQCRATKSIFEDDLHKRIVLLADNGNTIFFIGFFMLLPRYSQAGFVLAGFLQAYQTPANTPPEQQLM